MDRHLDALWASDPSPEPPTLFVLSPLQPDGVPMNRLAEEVCLATGFQQKDGEMGLNVKDQTVNVTTSNAVLSPTEKSYISVGFTNRTMYSCELNGEWGNNNNVDLCADLHPEEAGLNFLLLVMNGLRMVFTKTLAFNTILTIRAVLA